MKALVTGASGFIGSHLVARLAADGHEVTAWVRDGRDGRTAWGRPVAKRSVDLLDCAGVLAALEVAEPDVIFHLAGQSLPARSWDDPAQTMRTNIEGSLNLLEAFRKVQTGRGRLLMAGSSAQYGPGAPGELISEDAPAFASSPYAISKLAADQCAELYARAWDLDIVRFRPFAWIGPGKVGDVGSDVARRIVAIERGAPPRLAIGRTDVVRDMIDVRDGVAALLVLADQGAKGAAYNVCCGVGTSVAELIGKLRSLARVPVELVADSSLLRPVEELVKVGDPRRLHALGWRPTIGLEQSARDILDYWRHPARAGAP